MDANPNNPNLPADYFMSGVQGKLYQVVAPDGRVIVNFLPYRDAWRFLSDLHVSMAPCHRFKFQEVPQEDLFPPPPAEQTTDDQSGGA